MRPALIILVNALSLLCQGQGFYILDTLYTEIDAGRYFYEAPVGNNSYQEVLVFDDLDSDVPQHVVFSYQRDSARFLKTASIPVSSAWFYDADEQTILVHDPYSHKLIKCDLVKQEIAKNRSIPNGRNNSAGYAYTFNGLAHFIGAINNAPSADKPYAFFDFYQIDPKNLKLKKHEAIDFGIESLLSPLNWQTITFRNNQLVIYSLHTGKCFLLDHQWNLIDTLSIRPDLANASRRVYNQLLPEHEVSKYMHRPKDLLIDMQNSAIFTQLDIRKILFVNDTTLLLSYSTFQEDKTELLYYDLKNREAISNIIHVNKPHFLSILQYTYRVHFNEDGEGILHGGVLKEGAKLRHRFYRVKYSAAEALPLDVLESIQLADTTYKLDMSRFSGVMLVNEKYCANCYRKNKVGQGVLVVKEAPLSGDLAIAQIITKKALHVNGALVFVSPAEFSRLQESLTLNKIHPVLPEDTAE